MKNNQYIQMENRVKEAFDAATPDVLDAVLAGCEKEKGTVITMTNQKKSSKFTKWAVATAACFAMVIGCFAAYGALAPADKIDTAPKSPITSTASAVATVVTLDVNPSIEIKADATEKVLDVLALNKDAEIVIGENDFTGKDLDQTVSTLIDSMIEQGYLNQTTNSVLVSVENENEATGNSIKDKLANEITDKVTTEGINGSVIGQVVSSDDSGLAELAKAHGITVGKAKFICYIIGNENKNFADYIHYSITDLNALLKASAEENKGGKGEEKNYIGKDAALKIALEACKLTLDQLDEYPAIEIVVQRGEVFYDIFFKISEYVDEYNHSSQSFHYYVNAVTGKIPGAGVTEPNITAKEAIAIVLDSLGLTEDEISELECRFNDMESGLPMTYVVAFVKNGKLHAGLVDAMDGTHIRTEVY